MTRRVKRLASAMMTSPGFIGKNGLGKTKEGDAKTPVGTFGFNAEGTPGLGSAIFLHCMGPCKPYTGGCVAITENQMKVVMQNVKPDCTVVIDSLENLGGEF